MQVALAVNGGLPSSTVAPSLTTLCSQLACQQVSDGISNTPCGDSSLTSLDLAPAVADLIYKEFHGVR